VRVIPSSACVLVVDDNEDIRESLMGFLEDRGFVATGATNGRDALLKLRGTRALPCLIILDLMMPVMDGRAFREAQLRDPGLAGIPVVVVSAYKDVSALAEALGVRDHLPKPLDLDALLDLVRAHCSNC
jgi:CheY-like chemotaxis protein